MNYSGYKAKMEGFKGPDFPEKIDELNAIYKNALKLEGFILEENLRKIEGFEKIGFVGESLGIPWKKLSITRGEDREILFYFPSKFKEDTSITVYSKNSTSDEVNAVTSSLIDLLKKEKNQAEQEDKESEKIIKSLAGNQITGKIFGFFKKK